jgi:hypothetical protein
MIDKHSYYLDELVKNLDKVDEFSDEVCWIMKEGLYFKEKSRLLNSFCDLVIGYYNKDLVLIELKGSKNKRNKAISQINSSVNLMKDFFNYNRIYGKIVYYDCVRGYSYECINLE